MAATLEAFGAQVRDTVDLNTLSSDLRVIVEETMQPATVLLRLSTPSRLD